MAPVKPKRLATLVQVFLMSDGSIETKIKSYDGTVPPSFVYENLVKITDRLGLALERGEVK
jgi:hypothetical protein